MTSAIESAKRLAAQHAVAEHFSLNFSYVGIGSGSTIKYVVEAIAELLNGNTSESSQIQEVPNSHGIVFIPTGYQSRQVILEYGLTPMLYDQLPANVVLDVAFDGADEVDDDLNCIKGGGACLFQEKLVAQRARRFICVAEVAPIAAPSVITALERLGSVKPVVRINPLAKSGPLKTDQDFYIIDAPFATQLFTKSDLSEIQQQSGSGQSGVWEVTELATAIQNITGVLEVGLFCGYDGIDAEVLESAKGRGQKPIAVYFGMEDGSVTTRKRPEKTVSTQPS